MPAELISSNCSDDGIRLVGGFSTHEGRVEVCVNKVWGTVCDNDWSTEEANIVCNQLGFLSQGMYVKRYLSFVIAVLLYTGSIGRTGEYFGIGSGPIVMANVLCNGTESSLLDCSHTLESFICSHSKDAGVTCQGNDDIYIDCAFINPQRACTRGLQ